MQQVEVVTMVIMAMGAMEMPGSITAGCRRRQIHNFKIKVKYFKFKIVHLQKYLQKI